MGSCGNGNVATFATELVVGVAGTCIWATLVDLSSDLSSVMHMVVA